MGFFDKLFGKKKAPIPPSMPSPAPAPAGDPVQDPGMVKVFDQVGREFYTSRSEWVQSVLLPNIDQAWNDPEKLAGFIINGLHDELSSELLKASARLAAIDSDAQRGAVLHAITLLKSGRVDDSGRVLEEHIAGHGESGVVLTNLAKVYAEREDQTLVTSTLWRALELEPNQDNAVLWYEAIHLEKDGASGSQDALRRMAAIPGSWRAQLWLARQALEHRDLDQALSLYDECLSRAPRPVPADLLTQMSGDLGKQGHLPELVNRTGPHFIPEVHGLAVGNNLMKGHLDLGQFDQARKILDQLYALKRPDWRENLSYWDTELANSLLQTETVQAPAAPLQITLLNMTGPVWLNPESPAIELFPAKAGAGPMICFLVGTVGQATNSKKIQHQLADTAGRLSRALPLFLAEQMHWSTDARVSTLVPWVVGPPAGFVVSAIPWEDVQAAQFARQGNEAHDYAVTVHFSAQTDPWIVELRVIRTIDATCLGTLSASFAVATPETALPALALQLAAFLCQEADATANALPAAYSVPQAQSFPHYLLRLEQLLAVRCGGMDRVQSGFLSGEREILEGNLHLCLSHPDSVSVRLLFARTLQAMKKVRPDVVAEFVDKTEFLQNNHPLPGAAQGVIDRITREVFAA